MARLRHIIYLWCMKLKRRLSCPKKSEGYLEFSNFLIQTITNNLQFPIYSTYFDFWDSLYIETPFKVKSSGFLVLLLLRWRSTRIKTTLFANMSNNGRFYQIEQNQLIHTNRNRIQRKNTYKDWHAQDKANSSVDCLLWMIG